MGLVYLLYLPTNLPVRINHPWIGKYTRTWFHGNPSWDSVVIQLQFREKRCWAAKGQSEDQKFKIRKLKGTLQEINISHLGKRNIIFKMDFSGDMLVPRRVDYFNMLQWGFLKSSQSFAKAFRNGSIHNTSRAPSLYSCFTLITYIRKHFFMTKLLDNAWGKLVFVWIVLTNTPMSRPCEERMQRLSLEEQRGNKKQQVGLTCGKSRGSNSNTKASSENVLRSL